MPTKKPLSLLTNAFRSVTDAIGWTSPWRPSTELQTIPEQQANSRFGPGQPIPTWGTPDVSGRLWDFPILYNTQIGPRQDEGTSFEALRFLADYCELVRLAIETRKDQLSRLSWAIVPRSPQESSKDYVDEIARITDFLRYPDKNNDWAHWIRSLAEEVMVTDAAAIYPQYTKGGELHALQIFDGTTLAPKLNEWGYTPTPDEGPAFQQILKGVPMRNYTNDEIIYRPRNRRVNKMYGFSNVEQVIRTANISIRRQLGQLDAYTEGTIPASIMSMPESFTMEQIKEYQQFWDAMYSGNLSELRKLKMVPFGAKVLPMKEQQLFDKHEEWLARVICFAFSLPPTSLVSQTNRATAENMQEVAEEEGISPLLVWVKGVMDGIVEFQFKQPKLVFQWNEEVAVSPIDQAQIDKILIDTGIKSIDECRQERGYDPIGMDNCIITGSTVTLVKDIISGKAQTVPVPFTAPKPSGPTPPEQQEPKVKPKAKPKKSSHRLDPDDLRKINDSSAPHRALAKQLGIAESTVRYHRKHK
jgi:hypothetical protein